MIKTKLIVTWEPGQTEDLKPVMLQCNWVSRLACWITRHGYFVLGRTIRTNILDAVLHTAIHAPSIRHELTHVRQQAQVGIWNFLRGYWFEGKKASYEAEAIAAQTAEWPQWR